MNDTERELNHLRREISALRQELDVHMRSQHPYHPHGERHANADRPGVVMVPVLADVPPSLSDGAMVYVTAPGSGTAQTLRIRIAGVEKESGGFVNV